MYEEIEQDENVARGCVKIKEIIAYVFVRMEKEIDERTGKPTGKKKRIEKGSPYFCQTKEQEQTFKENNPGVRTEMFEIQLLKSTAIKYLNNPENIKQFTKKEEQILSEVPEKLDWLHQAHRLGIPTDGRTKEDILAEIESSKQIPATTSVS